MASACRPHSLDVPSLGRQRPHSQAVAAILLPLRSRTPLGFPPCSLRALPRSPPSSYSPRSGSSGGPRARVAAPAQAPPGSASPFPRQLQDQDAAAVLRRIERVPLSWQWTPAAGAAGAAAPPISIPIHALRFQDPQGPQDAPSSSSSAPTILLLPSVSDISTVDEWAGVASCLLARASAPSALGRVVTGAPQGDLQGVRLVAVDWPGFGASGSSKLLFTAELMEDFIVQFIAHLFPGRDVQEPVPLVVVGVGHAGSLALRAVARGRIRPAALAAVAPTWAGPLPIVFGNDEKMLARYGLFRSALRTPGIGWALYRYITSPKMIKMQYLTHVYADPDNVSTELVDSRTEITQREGGRYAPSSFTTGLLDPARTRDEFLALFAAAEEQGVPVAVITSGKSPKRSKREMEALEGAPGVASYQVCPGALLPQEEYPEELVAALEESFSASAFSRAAELV